MELSDGNKITCLICCDMIILPVKLPCKHNICMNCCMVILSKIFECPFCKQHINEDFDYVNSIDSDVESLVIATIGSEKYKTASENVLKTKERMDQSLKVKFFYGNTHKLTQDEDLPHEWTAFLRSESYDISLFVKKVVYILDPSFEMIDWPINVKPFELTKHAYASFSLGIKIYWNTCFELETTTFDHTMDFNKEISEKYFFMFFDKSKLKNKL